MVEGIFFDLSVGVSCTLGIIVLRVLISSCRSFIKFVNSSSIFLFLSVFLLCFLFDLRGSWLPARKLIC